MIARPDGLHHLGPGVIAVFERINVRIEAVVCKKDCAKQADGPRTQDKGAQLRSLASTHVARAPGQALLDVPDLQQAFLRDGQRLYEHAHIP